MVIYDNPRAWRVRIAQVAVWLFGAAIVWLAFFSNGHVGSFAEQIFVWVMGAASILVLAGTEFYLRAYVLKMRLETRLEITTLSFFGRRSIEADPAAISLGRERHDLWLYRSIVDNYWIPLNVPGEVLPLIVDTTAADIDMQALAKAAGSMRA